MLKSEVFISKYARVSVKKVNTINFRMLNDY